MYRATMDEEQYEAFLKVIDIIKSLKYNTIVDDWKKRSDALYKCISEIVIEKDFK